LTADDDKLNAAVEALLGVNDPSEPSDPSEISADGMPPAGTEIEVRNESQHHLAIRAEGTTVVIGDAESKPIIRTQDKVQVGDVRGHGPNAERIVYIVPKIGFGQVVCEWSISGGRVGYVCRDLRAVAKTPLLNPTNKAEQGVDDG
jgi:hypothetical protein